MRTATFKIETYDSVVRYPDDICFAFNPNFIEIESECQSGVLIIEVSKASGTSLFTKQEIKVSMYGGKAKIYLSRLFELMFDDPRNARCVEVVVNVKIATLSLISFDTLVIWGNLAVGERFGAIGVFNHDIGKAYFERNLIWFKNFPFTVPLFHWNQSVEFFGRYDGGYYSSSPIIDNGECLFFHEIDKVTSKLPDITSGSAGLPDKIIYYVNVRRFIAKKNDNYYENWASGMVQQQHIGSDSRYCAGDDKTPRGNVSYILYNESGNSYRYRYKQGALTCCGVFTGIGFEDIPANLIFPTCKHKATIKYKISEEGKKFSVFDSSFDYTFSRQGENVALINLQISHDTAGYYLRWVDRHGNLQYFLFTKGEVQYKNKLSTDRVLQDEAINGMYFANIMRASNIECSITMKCCAVNLPADIFDYVVTVVSAPIVDLYLGKDESGTEIWLPVTIQAGTVKYIPKQILNDLEFSFAVPSINSQSL